MKVRIMRKKTGFKWTALLLAVSLTAGDGAAVLLASAQEEVQTEENGGNQTEQTEAGDSQVASADEMAPVEEVVEEGMVPIYGDELNDGTYDAEVVSSSSMFKIVDCQLTVKEGEITALMTMSSDGYLKLFMGTGEEAAEAGEEEYIPFAENDEGQQTYQVPVEALDMGISCAAFSRRKEKWYDRTLVFKASSLPTEAFKEGSYTTPEDLNLAEGEYQIQVELSGGSGRTTVESPAVLTVKDGSYTARIIFSSPYYEYMIVDDVKYEPVNTEGNSAFEIPVTVFDKEQAVVADTIAMSEPHEISYTLYYDSSTVEAITQ